jgi:hypothetical protein
MKTKKHRLENKAITGLILGGLVLIGGIALIGNLLFGSLAEKSIEIALGILGVLTKYVLSAVLVFFNLLASICILVINNFILLDPFNELNIASTLWEFFKNISYVVLVFLSLWTGFQFILNRDDEARRLLIGILIIAFLINFTYLLAKEFFMFFWYLTKSVLDIVDSTFIVDSTLNNNQRTTTNFGETIYLTLSFYVGKKGQEIAEKISDEFSQIEVNKPANEQLIANASFLIINLFQLVMAFAGSAIMGIFAALAFGKFFVISFLVGVLPLACIAYLLPNQKNYFHQWWQMFLTWNVNILILIVLITIGIYLFASTTSDPSNFYNLFINNFQPQSNSSIFTSLNNISASLPYILVFSLRFLVIVVYYAIIINLSLRLGGSFATAGYNFIRLSWTGTGSYLANLGKSLATTPLSKLGGPLTKMADKLSARGPAGALVGKRIRGLGESLQKPTKKKAEETAREIYKALQNKGASLEEITQTANKLKGGVAQEFAKILAEEKSPDEIFKIFANSENLRKNEVARKILCRRKLNCALDLIMKEDLASRQQAILRLAQGLDFTQVDLGQFQDLLKNIGFDDKSSKELIISLAANLSDRNKRNFYANPKNLNALKEAGGNYVLQQARENIKQTATFRAFRSGLGKALETLGIQDPEIKKEILEEFENDYLSGGITSESFPKNNEEFVRKVKESLESMSKALSQYGDSESLEEKIKKDEEKLKTLENLASKPYSHLRTEVEEKILREIGNQYGNLDEGIKKEINKLKQELQEQREQLSQSQKYKGLQSTLSEIESKQKEQNIQEQVNKILSDTQSVLSQPITTPVRREEEETREAVKQVLQEFQQKSEKEQK